MSLEKNKAIARRLVENWHDPEILDELVATDIVNKRMAAAISVGFPDLVHVPEDIIAEGDKVVVRWTATGTHRGEWAGIPPTNKRVSVRGTQIFRIVGGKVVEQWPSTDVFELLVQLGVIPGWEEIAEQYKGKQA